VRRRDLFGLVCRLRGAFEPSGEWPSGVRVERALEVTKPPISFPLTALANNHVEARPSGSTRLFVHPGRRAAHQPQALARVHGIFARPGSTRAPGLHLHEDDEMTAPGDQIHLNAPRSDVATDDAITSRRQVIGGASLAFCTEFVSTASPRAVRC
jgi:hypothetical protein